MDDNELNEVFSKYGDQKIDISIRPVNLTNKDTDIINKIIPKDIYVPLQLKGIFDRIKYFYSSVTRYTTKTNNMDVYVHQGDQVNKLFVDCSFELQQSYIPSSLNYKFLLKPNQHSLSFIKNYYQVNNQETIKNSKVREASFSGGANFNLNRSKFSLFFHNNTIFNSKHNLELDLLFKLSKSNKDIKRKQDSSVTKILLTKNIEERSILFRDRLELDNINRFVFELGHKNLKNLVDQYGCPPEFVSNVPEKDVIHYFKVSYQNFKFYNNFQNNTFFYARSSLNKSSNSVYLKNKLFARRFFDFNSVFFQFNLEAGSVHNLKQGELKIHEKLFVNNLKGVELPSLKMSLEKNKSGDSLGLTRYLMINNKIFFQDIPFFNNFKIETDGFQVFPFVHFNFLFSPDLNKHKQEDDEEKPSPHYFSSGFGLNFISEYLTCEVYYNAYIKKNKKDISYDFSINFGVD